MFTSDPPLSFNSGNQMCGSLYDIPYLLTSELKPTKGRHRSGKSAFKHYQGVFYLLQTTHKPHFIYNLILISKVGFSFHARTYYYFSEFYLIIFKLLFVIMATMDITESGFQTPASKKR